MRSCVHICSIGGKKGKKAASAPKEADAELEALMAELEAPKPAAIADGKTDKKKKKKGGKGEAAAGGGEEDLDALLAEFGAAPVAVPTPSSNTALPPTEAAEARDNEDDKDEGESGFSVWLHVD